MFLVATPVAGGGASGGGGQKDNHKLMSNYVCHLSGGKRTCLSIIIQMGVSKNRGTPKWMVYKGKPH